MRKTSTITTIGAKKMKANIVKIYYKNKKRCWKRAVSILESINQSKQSGIISSIRIGWEVQAESYIIGQGTTTKSYYYYNGIGKEIQT